MPRDEKLPAGAEQQKMPRPDIVDRNGEVLARDIRVASLYAEPNKLIDIDEAVELLTANVPDLDARELRRKLSLDRSFIWLKRQVSPSEQQLIHDLGIPGIGFRDETLRVYPRGRLAAHVLGYVDVDSHGLAGIEKYLDGRGALYTASLADPGQSHASSPFNLSIDLADRACARRRVAEGDPALSRAKPAAAWCSMSPPARSSPWPRCPTSILTGRSRPSRRTPATA